MKLRDFEKHWEVADLEGFCGVCRYCSPLTCEKCTEGVCEELGVSHCQLCLGYCELSGTQVYYTDVCERFEQSTFSDWKHLRESGAD